MGHVLLVTSTPRSISRDSEEAHEVQAAWPPGNVPEMWIVHTIESTRSAHGLHEADLMMYVDRVTGKLILMAEMVGEHQEHINLTEGEELELWQSPWELRQKMRVDLMVEVLRDMKEHEADWSTITAARAWLQSARVVARNDSQMTLDKIQSCWTRAPICTSVVIVFWQRYLYRLGTLEGPPGPQIPGQKILPLDLILRWMPLKADRGLPGELLGVMKEVGWVSVSQIPRIFRPIMISRPVFATEPPMEPVTSQRPPAAKADLPAGPVGVGETTAQDTDVPGSPMPIKAA
eukprot:gnl/TRDRNA2_/TRDRNA2_135429_c0_seq1.p1 gnl/TRDRNA2_/TRDRNA2_135429_c0~~gnl/TRDRNA2_/TRDRNA2_135429_c0_seq1.p1  ORF type:complete len:326 (-),score=59.94 gnl/TRDRNA2_/TRDRNA2_135429_c0_seq1:67-936(-)